MGTPAASDLTLAPGAGHGDEGDASFQGSAQEQIEALPAQPKPTNPEPVTDVPNSLIEFAARAKKPEAAEVTAKTRKASGLVTVRPKPEKRKNAQQRAKERNEERNKDKVDVAEMTAAASEAAGLATAHPKPEKRKNAKERAKEIYAKVTAKDGIKPTTATTKSKAKTKAKKSKSAADKAA
jgi:hypothetical protein